MSLFNLIMKVKNCTFSEAIKFVANEIGISNRYGFNNTIPMISQELLKIDKYIQLRKPKKTEIKHLPEIDGKILNYVLQGLAINKWLVQKGVHRVKCVLRIAVFHGNIIPAEGADGTRYSVILEFNVTKIHIYFVPKHFCGHGTQHLPEIRSQAPAYTLTIVP